MRVLQAEGDWNSERSPLRPQLLHQPFERQVLVRIGAQAVSRTRASSSRNRGLPARSVRSTSVLTKKPISPSISPRSRPATGVPTDDVALARDAVEQRLEAGEQDHEEGRALAPRERGEALPRDRRRAGEHLAAAAVAPAPAAGAAGRQRQLERPAARRPAAAASSRAAPPRAPRRDSQARCQTAKSAYCTGSSGSGDGRPAAKAA